MLFIPPCACSLREVKLCLTKTLPDLPSAKLSEALAASAGFNTNAALRSSLWTPGVDPAELRALSFDDVRFARRLGDFKLDLPTGWQGFDTFGRSIWVGNRYQSKKGLAGRNVMVAAILSGLTQRIFTLDPDGSFWPDAKVQKGTLFHVWMPHDIPAQAWVSDIGMGELSIHVACWPTGRFLSSGNAGFEAGDAVVKGWLERETGKWLMNDGRGGLTINIRRNRVEQLSSLVTPTVGFADQGRFIM